MNRSTSLSGICALAAALLVAFAAAPAYGQSDPVDCSVAPSGTEVTERDGVRYVRVFQCPAPGEDPAGVLNRAVAGDTTAAGEQIPNTVFVLERGGFYLLNGSLANREPLEIISETWFEPPAGFSGFTENPYDRPQLVPAVLTGGETDRPFTARGDLTLKGLYVTGLDEEGGLILRVIRLQANDLNVRLTDVHIDRAGQSAFRVDNDDNNIFLENSIVSNIGVPGNPANGRGIDDRGRDIRTFSSVNTTWYNITSTILNDRGGDVRTLVFDQNTAVNVGQSTLGIGELGRGAEIRITNNVFIDHGFYGEVRNINDTDGPERYALFFEGTVPSDASVTISNNNFYRDPLLEAEVYPEVSQSGFLDENERLVPIGIISPPGEAFFTVPTVSEDLSFASSPARTGDNSPAAIIRSYFSDDRDITPFLDSDLINLAPLLIGQTPLQEVFDFAYPVTAQSYTAGTTGQPLGALTWYPSLLPTPPSARAAALDGLVVVDGVAPNPSAGAFSVIYRLAEPSYVTVEVFDVLGRRVAGQPQAFQDARSHVVRFDEYGLASGTYVVRIQAEGRVHAQPFVIAR
jgi:hypothetical protein